MMSELDRNHKKIAKGSPFKAVAAPRYDTMLSQSTLTIPPLFCKENLYDPAS